MTVFWYSGFESGDLRGFYWNQNKPNVVASPVRLGNYSMRSYLHRYESPYDYRTMVQVGSDDDNPEGTRASYSMTIGQEYWVGFSMRVGSDFEADLDGCDELWFQFQAVPDPGELWRSPILAIYISESVYNVVSRWDTQAYRPDSMSWTGKETIASLSVLPDVGTWVDWVFHVKWSWQSDGLIELWHGGDLIATRNGPNCSNDSEGPRISFGVYKWPWKAGSGYSCDSGIVDRTIYIDEFAVGDSDSSYNEVVPGGELPSDDRAARITWAEMEIPTDGGTGEVTIPAWTENDIESGTTFALTKPEGLQDEDYLAAWITKDEDDAIIGPSGWTEDHQQNTPAGHDFSSGLWYKRITNAGGESSSYDWTTSLAMAWAGTLMILRGVDSATPIDVATTTANGADNPDPPCPSISTVTDKALVLCCAGSTSWAASSSTEPSGTTKVNDIFRTNALNLASYLIQDPAGATGTRTWDTDGDPGDEWHACQAAFRPGPAYYRGLDIHGVGEIALCDAGSHPLRVHKGDTTYGIELVAIDDPNASAVRIQTPAGIRALREYT